MPARRTGVVEPFSPAALKDIEARARKVIAADADDDESQEAALDLRWLATIALRDAEIKRWERDHDVHCLVEKLEEALSGVRAAMPRLATKPGSAGGTCLDCGAAVAANEAHGTEAECAAAASPRSCQPWCGDDGENYCSPACVPSRVPAEPPPAAPTSEGTCYACNEAKPVSDMCDACHSFAAKVNLDRLTAERDEARARVAVLEEALGNLLGVCAAVDGRVPRSFREWFTANTAAAALVAKAKP